jgi:hypothetical protein
LEECVDRLEEVEVWEFYFLLFFYFYFFYKKSSEGKQAVFFLEVLLPFFFCLTYKLEEKLFFMDYLGIREGVIKTRKNLISSQYGKKSSKIYFIPKMVEKGISKSHWLPKQQVLNHYWKSNRP